MKTDASQGPERKTVYLSAATQWKLIKKRGEKKLVWSGFRRTAVERFSHLARHYRGGSTASSVSPSFFFKFLCGIDGAQQSIASSGRIQAPFHCKPMLITPNKRYADGASLEIRQCPWCSMISLSIPRENDRNWQRVVTEDHLQTSARWDNYETITMNLVSKGSFHVCKNLR